MGIDLSKLEDDNLSKRVASQCYDLGLVIERSGRNDTVLKIMPPLTIEMDNLEKGLTIVRQAILGSIK